MATDQPTADQLVREIRREEAYIAQLRSMSAGRRASLLERLVKECGSASEAARRLGNTPQAVSKALAAARREQELSELSTDASINAISVRLAGEYRGVGWASDVVTDAEWHAIEDPDEKRRAAKRAMEAWLLRGAYTEALGRFLGLLADGCEEVAEYPEEETASPFKVWEIVQGESMKLPPDLLPSSREQAAEIAQFVRVLAQGLVHGTMQRTILRWQDRAENDAQ